ncbi:hypothetical protein C8Q76DRAFT_690244 [Earliella scabrosa]|nr:hypothetical protein C8Q76DRAFT_690244 [Earliella scabrosa]
MPQGRLLVPVSWYQHSSTNSFKVDGRCAHRCPLHAQLMKLRRAEASPREWALLATPFVAARAQPPPLPLLLPLLTLPLTDPTPRQIQVNSNTVQQVHTSFHLPHPLRVVEGRKWKAIVFSALLSIPWSQLDSCVHLPCRRPGDTMCKLTVRLLDVAVVIERIAGTCTATPAIVRHTVQSAAPRTLVPYPPPLRNVVEPSLYHTLSGSWRPLAHPACTPPHVRQAVEHASRPRVQTGPQVGSPPCARFIAMKTDRVAAPGDAIAAALASHGDIITSPNQHWVPVWPREPQVLRTYTDGTGGLHEYSRWPQTVIPNMWHVACIPTRGSDDDLPDVLWISLCPSRDWIEDRFCGLIGHGFLVESIRSDLHRAAEDIIARARAITGVSPRRMAFVRELILVLQQCVERMRRLPSLPVMAVAVGAHIQRLSLELLGLERYLLIVLPRLESGRDYSSTVLPTLGGFVVDRTTAARSVRCGLPTWLVQPFRPDIRVWRVVECTYPPHVPPSHLATVGPQPLAEITNVAGNWLGSMVFAISRQLCDLQLPSLAPEIGAVHALKRHRLTLQSKTMTLRLAPRNLACASSLEPSRPLANSRAVKHTPALSPRPGPGPSTEARTRSANSHDGPRHPSRQYVPSPFYTPPTPWLQALRGVKTLGPPPQSVVYFYPPPFLLDSVCAAAPLPQTLRGFVGAREDDKIPRYLHNLVRIREYCRLRVLDPRLAGRALTIAEWRAALWGDYDQKPEPVVRGTEGEQRRAKRKHQEKSDIGRLFGDGAAVESYSLADAPLLNGVPISAEQAARAPVVSTFVIQNTSTLVQ